MERLQRAGNRGGMVREVVDYGDAIHFARTSNRRFTLLKVLKSRS